MSHGRAASTVCVCVCACACSQREMKTFSIQQSALRRPAQLSAAKLWILGLLCFKSTLCPLTSFYLCGMSQITHSARTGRILKGQIFFFLKHERRNDCCCIRRRQLKVHEICGSSVHLCRLHGVVMDGRCVPADVLFFYKTLPLRTGAQGRACHACDE